MKIPESIENDRLLLRWIQREDLPKLRPHIYEPSNWEYGPSVVSNENDEIKYFEKAEADRRSESRFLYTVFDKQLNLYCGCTAYGTIVHVDERLEIGWTWLGIQFRRTGINRIMKYMMLQTAFEEMKCKRVEFKTDILNNLSRNALKGIGAFEEGVLRSHTLLHSGRRRDTLYFSILEDEWEGVKNRLKLYS